ncbi:Uncharacterised protein [Urinicoccus massiliensis]|uniref:Uncharacterized protein n=1 Tax=Urinicoccus massiliensis TaxID=1723382 RepID=A0A8H2M740_9FIRM|nr:hypothetical protein [Urinicoccus massiliensis]VFB17198.1 Uncharacterised protein [Urinicoccus massiliensis]
MEFKQKKVTVEGVEYTLQKLPIRKALEIRQKWTLPNGTTSDLIMYEECLKHIVVEPKVKIDDFEELYELELLVGECLTFQFLEKKKKTSKDK